jgi:hypothetical protein
MIAILTLCNIAHARHLSTGFSKLRALRVLFAQRFVVAERAARWICAPSIAIPLASVGTLVLGLRPRSYAGISGMVIQ